MEIRCETFLGLKPDVLDRLSGLKPDDAVSTVSVMLVNPGHPGPLANKDRARVVASVLLSLARGRSINLLFPYDVNEARRKLRILRIECEAKEGVLLVEIPSSKLPILCEILEATAFTTSYAWIDGVKPPPPSPSLLFEQLDAIFIAAVLALYDDSIELLSKQVPAKEMVNSIRAAADEEGIPVSCSEQLLENEGNE